METQDKKGFESKTERWEHNRSGRAMGGLIIVGFGAVLLARQLGYHMPDWVFSWQMILIVVGTYIGARHSFRNPSWLILVGVGTVFLLDEFILDISLGEFVWPVIIIFVGLIMIFKPRRKKRDKYWKHWGEKYLNEETSSEDFMDSVAVFGSLKKNIITKDFKGGEASMVFSGAEINLSQADIQGKVTIELTQVFAGTKLIVPPHWIIHTDDLVCIFGGVEDKRPIRQNPMTDTDKVLILKGTCIFGGIDIKSY